MERSTVALSLTPSSSPSSSNFLVLGRGITRRYNCQQMMSHQTSREMRIYLGSFYNIGQPCSWTSSQSRRPCVLTAFARCCQVLTTPLVLTYSRPYVRDILSAVRACPIETFDPPSRTSAFNSPTIPEACDYDKKRTSKLHVT